MFYWEKGPKLRRFKHDFAYTGFIRCGECGCLYTAQTNKKILMALGKNITIIDGKLSIEPNDWLIPVKENYPSLEEQY